jgi:hypothetical protein
MTTTELNGNPSEPAAPGVSIGHTPPARAAGAGDGPAALFEDYREIWLVDFGFRRPPGERPTPFYVAAREWRSGQEVRLEGSDLRTPAPPYPLGPEALFVAYDAPSALGCHLALGWGMPAHVLDLHAEFRCHSAGLIDPGVYELPDALACLRSDGDGLAGLDRLLRALAPRIDLPRALLRGWYAAAVARMEWTGIPMDTESLGRLRAGWDRIKDELIERVDRDYGAFEAREFQPARWAAWLARNDIPWPRLPSGELDLSLDAFRDMAKAYPRVGPMKELCASLAQLRRFRLAVGPDGRNRCPLRPFAAKTGRNQPSTSRFVFGPATWVRGLIKPPEGMALAYVDWSGQEYGIAAALSGDEAMQADYLSGDPYLAFAKRVKAVPPEATKATHPRERESFKTCCGLGAMYGAGAQSLAVRLGISVQDARGLLRQHHRTYRTFWRWSDAVRAEAEGRGELVATYGWKVHVRPEANPRSLRNFPMQANGAEMMRLACCFLTEAGVRVCAPVHDALLIEAPAADIDRAVEACQQEMGRASEAVLGRFALRTEAKVVRFPDRYMDGRGQAMWDTVFGLLDGEAVARCT